MVGSSGGEYGVRGHLDAFKRETGERAWRSYMVPKPGEPGSETWPEDGEAWQRGGGQLLGDRHVRRRLNILYGGPAIPGRLRRKRAAGQQPLHRLRRRRRPGRRLAQALALPVDAPTTSGTTTQRWRHPVDMDGRKLPAHFDRTDTSSSWTARRRPRARYALRQPDDWGEVDAKGKVTPKLSPDKEGVGAFWPGPAGNKEWVHASTARTPSSCTGRSGRRVGHEASQGVQRGDAVLGRPASPRTPRTWPIVQRLRPPHRQGGLALEERHPDGRSLLATAGDWCSLASRPASSTRPRRDR